MKRREILAAVIAIGLVYTLTTVQAATVTLSIDGVSSGLLPTFVDGGVTIIGTGPATPGYTYTSGGANGATINVQGALDPATGEIVYVSGVTDHGTVDSEFGYSFILDLATPQANATVEEAFSGGVTNGSGAGDVTITALPPGALPVDVDGITELMTYYLSDDGGSTWKNVNLDAGPSATIPANSSASTPYGNFDQGPISGPAGGPWTHMRVDLNFRLSSGEDKFNFSGSANIPEPSALLLASLGLAALVGFGRRSVR